MVINDDMERLERISGADYGFFVLAMSLITGNSLPTHMLGIQSNRMRASLSTEITRSSDLSFFIKYDISSSVKSLLVLNAQALMIL